MSVSIVLILKNYLKSILSLTNTKYANAAAINHTSTTAIASPALRLSAIYKQLKTCYNNQ